MGIINAHAPVCVNAMWQSSRSEQGPSARCALSWGSNSLVAVLVKTTLDKAARKEKSQSTGFLERFVCRGQVFLTPLEQVQLARTGAEASALLPNATQAQKTLMLLRRLAFAKSVGDVLQLAGMDDHVRRYTVAGSMVQVASDIPVSAVMRAPPPSKLLQEERSTLAIALLLCSAPRVLDYDAERALRGVVRGVRGNLRPYDDVVCMIVSWLAQS